MKRWVFVISVIMFLVALPSRPTCASDKPYGQLRALKRRAATVVLQKNDFVARVLNSHRIAYQRNKEGVVVRLQIGSKWLEVNRIEIVPMLRQGESDLDVVGHEIFFYTEGEILHLVSALTIR
jgi:hypothetical protein